MGRADDTTTGSRSRGAVRLIAICLLAGLLVAGITFPVAGGLGLLAEDSGSAVKIGRAHV